MNKFYTFEECLKKENIDPILQKGNNLLFFSSLKELAELYDTNEKVYKNEILPSRIIRLSGGKIAIEKIEKFTGIFIKYHLSFAGDSEGMIPIIMKWCIKKKISAVFCSAPPFEYLEKKDIHAVNKP